jgi:hypothetical protein
MFVQNCRVDTTQTVRMAPHDKAKANTKGGRRAAAGGSVAEPAAGEEAYNPVQCATCGTEVRPSQRGLRARFSVT